MLEGDRHYPLFSHVYHPFLFSTHSFLSFSSFLFWSPHICSHMFLFSSHMFTYASVLFTFRHLHFLSSFTLFIFCFIIALIVLMSSSIQLHQFLWVMLVDHCSSPPLFSGGIYNADFFAINHHPSSLVFISSSELVT